MDFEAANPMAHTLACLRFAGLVAETVARLATGSGGLPLAGRASHPLDDERSFMESSHPPFPFDQQGPVALNFLCPMVIGEDEEVLYGNWILGSSPAGGLRG